MNSESGGVGWRRHENQASRHGHRKWRRNQYQNINEAAGIA